MKVFWILCVAALCHPLFSEAPGKILIIYTEAGGGHKATASALEKELKNRYKEVEIHSINAHERIGGPMENGRFRALETLYTKNLGSSTGRWANRLYGDYLIGPITRFLEFLGERQMRIQKQSHPLIQFLKEENPDLVISTASFINRHFKNAIDYAELSTPFIVAISDFDEAERVMWTSAPHGTHYIVRNQAKLLNPLDAKYIHSTSGVCIRPEFSPLEMKNYQVLEDLDLAPDKPTALICFGGYGSEEMVDLAHYFDRHPENQAIFITGTNQSLANRLNKIAGSNCRVLGFVPDIHKYMQACHVLIGKPGPGTVTEAVHSHLPLYVKGGIDLMKQEEGVLEWVLQENFGARWDTTEEFSQNFSHILTQLAEFKKNIESTSRKNPTIEAVDHIVHIFEQSKQELAVKKTESKIAHYTFY